MLGFFTLDLMVFPEGQELSIWAVGLDCYLNDLTSAQFLATYMTGTEFDVDRSLSVVEESSMASASSVLGGGPACSFLYAPMVENNLLTKMELKTFFKMCRMDNISFDIKKRAGIIFTLLDSLQSGVIGLMAFSSSPDSIYRYMNNGFTFLSKKVGVPPLPNVLSDDSRTDHISFSNLSHAFRSLQRKH
jgi:hypothetical protein